MEWNEYCDNYIKMAKLFGKTDEYCIEQLAYAKRLFDQGLPIIYSQKHLCKLVGFSEEYVLAVSNSSRKFYKSFSIPKRNGKAREINAPLPNLKEIQRWILEEILNYNTESPYSKAFNKGVSVKDNAKFHRKQDKVLSMDLDNFFPSISFGRVLNLFRNMGYRESVAVMLSNLCCKDGVLPQGAPTSPKIANLIARRLDYEIWELVANRQLRYTRYADDITISGEFDEKEIIKKITYIVKRNGFNINKSKTKVMKRNNTQIVTGIVVNEKLQVAKEIRRKLRLEAYYIEKYGLENHMKKINETRASYLYHLIGLASYCLFINPKDEHVKGYFEVFKQALNK